MTGRVLPADCPCPRVRHPDGDPLICWPDPACRHHGRPHTARLATVTPIRKG
ncbi:hypothetical protein [Streptomyces turgidiscabies]|uniref:hypothetical protein n=1 Tax=Streptomyces turgidiscabies TaxID=85558 RepID=UPI0038F60DB3